MLTQKTLSKEQALLVQKWILESPEYFLRHVLGENPWQTQLDIIDSVKHNRTTAVRSCHGSGKTWTAARTILWYLYAYPNSICLSTAPTYRQVVELIWREIRTAHKKARIPLGGVRLRDRLDIDTDWYALGLSTGDPDYFQGFHSEHILVVVDEPPGVQEPIFNAIDGILSTASSRLLMIGNPTSLSGRFYDSFKKPNVSKVKISAFDTPNFTANGISSIEELKKARFEDLKVVNPRLVSPQWVMEKVYEWGEDSPLFQARVFGDFPAQGDKTLIPLNKIEQATTEERLKELEYKYSDQKGGTLHHYGVDVARYGEDQTVILRREEDIVRNIISFAKQDTMETVGAVMAQTKDIPGRVNVDVIGIGSGVVDRLEELGLDHVTAVNVAESPLDPERFGNLRAEIFWTLREKFINDEIYIPNDQMLIAELSAIEYKFTSRGQIMLESKDDLKKRTGRSPDRADALALSYTGVSSAKNFSVGKHSLFRR